MRCQPIKQIRISILIAKEIRTSILGSNMSPGDKLPPLEEMAKSLGVSKPSVREAISILSASGIVISSRRRGTVVSGLRDACSDRVLSELACIVENKRSGRAAQ